MIGHKDKNNINSPFDVGGKMIAMRNGGHRVYWSIKGSEPEVFPDSIDTGFYALMDIGWYKIGEVPTKPTSETKRGRKPKDSNKKTRKLKKKSRKHSDSESDSEFENESVAENESEFEDCRYISVAAPARSTNKYKEITQIRPGNEMYWRRVGRKVYDHAEKLSFTAAAVVVRVKEKGKTSDDEKMLFYQYYNNQLYPNGPPRHEDEFEYSTCAEMDPGNRKYGQWAEWEDIPDCSTDPLPAAPPPNSVSAFANEQPDADACKQADVPVWKGYTVLTEEELEERKRKQLSDVPVVLESRMRKRRG